MSGGFASAGLIAWALTAKYADHLPLYRQEKMLARWRASISRQNLCDWVAAATTRFEPLVKRMLQDLLAGGYVQVDEMSVRCNDPDLKDGKTTHGWLWALSRPGGDAVFVWRLFRQHKETESLLGDYQGPLQSDGYEAYPAYVRTRPDVVWLGCWAHARRKFHEALAEAPVRAGFVLGLIGRLYHYESMWREIGSELRAARSQGRFGLPLALLKKTAQRLQAQSLPRSLLGQACAYLLSHWAPLTAHLQHDRTQLDTNAVENAIRPSKLGAKNWLFIGHLAAGDRAASLIVSAQRRGLDPHAYLKEVLARLPAMTNQDDLTPLLPARWQPPSCFVALVATTPSRGHPERRLRCVRKVLKKCGAGGYASDRGPHRTGRNGDDSAEDHRNGDGYDAGSQRRGVIHGGAAGLDQPGDSGGLVDAEVVEEDYVASVKVWTKNMVHIRGEDLHVGRSLDQEWSVNAVEA